MQILHPFAGSIQQYFEVISDPDRYRPDHCPQCQAKPPLTAHGFYHRTLNDVEFDGNIPVRRYLCNSCKRNLLCPSCVSVFP
jgi:transposase-like protein